MRRKKKRGRSGESRVGIEDEVTMGKRRRGGGHGGKREVREEKGGWQ